MTQHTAFRAYATMQQSVLLDSRFGVGLDSLLASAIRKREKAITGLSGSELDGGAHYLSETPLRVVELPLARCTAGPHWHWQSTCAVVLDANGAIVPQPEQTVRTWIQKDDHVDIERMTDTLPANLPTSSGRWRKRRVAVPVVAASELMWQGYGDVDAVEDLLNDIHSLGGKRNAGEGAVLCWRTEVIDVSQDVAGHFHHETQRLLRPSFEECVDLLTPIDKTRLNVARVGLRPPYWHLSHQYDLYIPTP